MQIQGLLHHLTRSTTRQYTKPQIHPTPLTDGPTRVIRESASVPRRRGGVGERGNRRRRWVVGVCRDWGMLGCESSSYAACVACRFDVVVVVCCGANVCVKWCAGLQKKNPPAACHRIHLRPPPGLITRGGPWLCQRGAHCGSYSSSASDCLF